MGHRAITLVVGLALSAAVAQAGQSFIPCSAQQAPTRTARGAGLSELTGELLIECSNVNFNLSNVILDVRLNTSAGAFAADLDDPLVILNDPTPIEQVIDSGIPPPVIVQNIRGNIYRFKQIGADRLIAELFEIQPESDNTVRLRVANVRISPTESQGGIFASLLPKDGIAMTSVQLGPNLSLNTNPLPPEMAGEIVDFAVRIQIGETVVLTPEEQEGVILPPATSLPLIQFAEIVPDIARKRIETTGGPEPVGNATHQNLPGVNYGTESGFTPTGENLARNGGGIGVATNGMRFYIVIEDVPSGVGLETPGCIPAVGTLGMELRAVTGFDEDYAGGVLTPTCGARMDEPNGLDPLTLVYEVVGDPGVSGRTQIDSYTVPLGVQCVGDGFGLARITAGVGPLEDAPILLASEEGKDGVIVPKAQPRFLSGREVVRELDIDAQCDEPVILPLISEGGLTEAAGFTHPPTGGALSSLFGVFGSTLGSSASIPLSVELSNTRLRLSAPGAPAAEEGAGPQQGGGIDVPLLFVSDLQINFQVPWEVDTSSGKIVAQVTVDGLESLPVELEVGDISPGVFSFDFGPGRAVAINLDGTVAHPIGSFPDQPEGYSRPVKIGEYVILLMTGLGPTIPGGITGDDSIDSGTFVRRDTIATPRVLIGGVEQNVVFSGLSPEFVGVNQLNFEVLAGTPVGDAVSLVVEAGGLSSRGDVTIAVAP